MAETIEQLKVKKDDLQEIANELKDKRDSLHKKSKQLAEDRDKLNATIRSFRNEINDHNTRRDDLNELVQHAVKWVNSEDFGSFFLNLFTSSLFYFTIFLTFPVVISPTR